MSTRFAYFALSALLGTVLAAALLVAGYDRLTVVNLTDLGAEKNWAIASTLSSAAQDELRALLVPADAASGAGSARQFLFIGIHALADVEALAHRIGEQRRRDFLAGEGACLFEFGNQGCGGLVKGAACRAVHFFSNLSAAELMQ